MKDENKVWARPINRKKDYYPTDENGKLIKGAAKRSEPLAVGTTLDFYLRALFPSLSKKQREAIARMGGMSLKHRVYTKYTPFYLSLQRHKVDTTIVYLKNGKGHEIGEVARLSINESHAMRKGQSEGQKKKTVDRKGKE